MKKQNSKKVINIILSVILVIGILLTSFGAYAIADLGGDDADPAIGESVTGNENGIEINHKYKELDLGDAANTAVLNEKVNVLSGAAADKISSALVSVENMYGPYNDDGRLDFVFSGNREELFGELSSGDFILINGSSTSVFGNAYIMKIESLYETDEEVHLQTSQPELGDVFDSIDIGINDPLTQTNLVSEQTAPGVSLEFSNNAADGVSYRAENANDLSSASFNGEAPAPSSLAADVHTVNPSDLTIKIDYDLSKNKEDSKKEDEDEHYGAIDGSASAKAKIKGKFGLKNLCAYMVVDMPSPFKYEEVMFGIRGEKFIDVGIDINVKAGFEPQSTKFQYDGIFIDAEVSGLNEKWIPLGIWHFVGTTPIQVTTAEFETLRATPSIFLMLYMNADGEIKLDFSSTLEFSEVFNSGLSVFKNGKLNMNIENYPYYAADGSIKENGEKDAEWTTELTFDANATIVPIGASVQFYFAGINLGEAMLAETGVEGNCHASVKASTKDGITSSNDDGSSELYLRGFLKLLGFNAKISAEVEAFQHNLNVEGEYSFLLVDFTLFQLGQRKSTPHTTPVSSNLAPAEFASVVTIVGDVSGSMDSQMDDGKTKVEALREAAHVITKVISDSSEKYQGDYGIGVVQFSGNAKTIALPHNDYPFIDECIDYMGDGGGTDIAAGLEYGITQLKNVKAQQKTIILMTDGEDSNYSGIMEQAEIAKNSGIKVYTIGFGYGANEELLTQIATATGAEYKFASTESVVGIIGSFLYAYESSQGEVLLDNQGTVSEGETVKLDAFRVPDKQGDLNATLYWPGSYLDLILVDPNNREVDENYPGVEIDNSGIPSTVTVIDPIPGKWSVKVKGVETSYDEEPFYAITSFKTMKRLDAIDNPKLDTLTLAGAYCLPIGLFTALVAAMLLVAINKKQKDE